MPPPAFPDVDQGLDTVVTGVSAEEPFDATHRAQTLSAPSFAAYGAVRTRDVREEAYERALRAGLRPPETGAKTLGVASASHERVSDRVVSEIDPGTSAGFVWPPARFGDVPAGVASLASRAPGVLAGGKSVRSPHDGPDGRVADLARDPEPTAYVRSRIKEPVSEYQIMAGTLSWLAFLNAQPERAMGRPEFRHAADDLR